MRCLKFTKDVLGGINALRSKIVNATGLRLLKVLNTQNNKKVITAISKHAFRIDGQGNPTMEPNDEIGIADICDAARYIAQNLFPVRGTYRPDMVASQEILPENKSTASEDLMKAEIARLTGGTKLVSKDGRKGGFWFSS
jgi:hypothetical protein